MDIIVFGINATADKLAISQDYNILAFLDNDLRRCKEGYHGCKVIHPIETQNYSQHIIVITDDMTDQIGACRIYEKIEQLTVYGVNCDKIYGIINEMLVPYCVLQDALESTVCNSYEQIFETVHSKSILTTHRNYVVERCRGRKTFIYGIGYEALCVEKMLRIMGIQVEKYINDKKAGNYINDVGIIEVFDLVYEDSDNCFVIVADESESYGVSREKLLSIGFREDVNFTYHAEIPGTNEPFYYDVTLSYSRVRDTMEGFELYGDIHNPNAVTIAVLGGSTTESQLFFVKGWVPFFAEYLHNADIPAKIYCGGISGYTSSQELLKFERDVVNLSPNIVISYSGVNDLYMFPSKNERERINRPFITKFQVQFIQQVLEKLSHLQFGLPTPDIPDWQKGGRQTVFYGLQNTKSASCFWIDNMRMIHALAQEFGMAFFSFFQPFRFNGYYKSTPTQEIIHSRRDPSCTPSLEGQKIYERREEVEEIRKLIPQYSYITDLSELFLGESNIYYDSVHVYEKGNQLIAQRIGEFIIKYLRSKGK